MHRLAKLCMYAHVMLLTRTTDSACGGVDCCTFNYYYAAHSEQMFLFNNDNNTTMCNVYLLPSKVIHYRRGQFPKQSCFILDEFLQ